MSVFVRVFRYLDSLYPPAQIEVRNPSILSESVQLVQEAIPMSELIGEELFPVQNTVAGGAGADFVQDSFVNPDGTAGTPTGVEGTAFVVWAAEVRVALAVANSLRFVLQDGTGVEAGRVGVGATVDAAAIGTHFALTTVPLIVPARFALAAQDNAGGSTLTLRVLRSTVQRGQRLPFF